VTFFLNGLKVLEREVPGWEVNIGIRKDVAGTCLVQMPGIRVSNHI
jgi:hypothetical protein